MLLPWVVVGVVLMQLAWTLLLRHQLRPRRCSWQRLALGPESSSEDNTNVSVQFQTVNICAGRVVLHLHIGFAQGKPACRWVAATEYKISSCEQCIVGTPTRQHLCNQAAQPSGLGPCLDHVTCRQA